MFGALVTDCIIYSLTSPKLSFHIPTLILLFLPKFRPGALFLIKLEDLLTQCDFIAMLKDQPCSFQNSMLSSYNILFISRELWFLGKNHTICLCISSLLYFWDGICPMGEVREEDQIQIWFYPELTG